MKRLLGFVLLVALAGGCSGTGIFVSLTEKNQSQEGENHPKPGDEMTPAEVKRIKEFEARLPLGVDIEDSLVHAIEHYPEDMVLIRGLIKKGAKLNASLSLLLNVKKYEAINYELAGFLIKSGAEVTNYHLRLAIERRDKRLIAFVADSAKDSDKRSMLKYVLYENYQMHKIRDIVSLLLDKGANPESEIVTGDGTRYSPTAYVLWVHDFWHHPSGGRSSSSHGRPDWLGSCDCEEITKLFISKGADVTSALKFIEGRRDQIYPRYGLSRHKLRNKPFMASLERLYKMLKAASSKD